MKITKSQLKQIIKEQLMINENVPSQQQNNTKKKYKQIIAYLEKYNLLGIEGYSPGEEIQIDLSITKDDWINNPILRAKVEFALKKLKEISRKAKIMSNSQGEITIFTGITEDIL